MDRVTDLNHNKILEQAKDPQGVTLTFDGWKNVSKESILGVVLNTSKGQTLVWDAMNISADQGRAVDVIEKVEELMFHDTSKVKQHGVKVIAVVTDSASPYASARTQLRRSHREIVWLPCFAHQLNLCIADIL